MKFSISILKGKHRIVRAMRFVAVSLSLCLLAAYAQAAEKKAPQKDDDGVRSMHIHLEIATDGTITVTELFKNFEASFTRRPSEGIGSRAPFVMEPPIKILKAYADGKPIPNLPTGELTSGQFVRLGDGRGAGSRNHTYLLVYETKGRILFKRDRDELVWDLRGAPTPYPIKGSLSIAMPKGVEYISKEAWQGHETTDRSPVSIVKNVKGNALFKGQTAMKDGHVFVVRVAWKKGIIQSDGSDRQLFFLSSGMWGMAVLAFLFCLAMWWKFGKDPRRETKIPLFYPPVLEDGTILSPAAVDYIKNAANLTSRGFSGLLLNLTAQRAMYIKGQGTRKEPYRFVRAKIVPQSGRMPSKPHDPQKNPGGLWNWLLLMGQGFDGAERLTLESLFSGASSGGAKEGADLEHFVSTGGDEAAEQQEYTAKEGASVTLKTRRSWSVALARDEAYGELASDYRSLWLLQVPIVIIMHIAVYVGVLALLAIFWAMYGEGLAEVCAVVTLAMGLVFLIYKGFGKIQRILFVWREMGWHNLALLLLYCVSTILVLFYNGLLGGDLTFADFPGWQIMQDWGGVLCALCMIGLCIYLLWLTRSASAVFLSPLKLLGFLCLLLLPAGCLFVTDIIPAPAAIPMLIAIFVPALFIPIMKKPTEACNRILTAIAGFEMYIRTTEASRLTVLNAPERTPEEFHKVLPYAVALGLEKAWGEKFTGIVSAQQFRGDRMGMLARYEHRQSGA